MIMHNHCYICIFTNQLTLQQHVMAFLFFKRIDTISVKSSKRKGRHFVVNKNCAENSHPDDVKVTIQIYFSDSKKIYLKSQKLQIMAKTTL